MMDALLRQETAIHFRRPRCSDEKQVRMNSSEPRLSSGARGFRNLITMVLFNPLRPKCLQIERT